MAWRIHDSVIRGVIDNRAKGRIRGRIWLQGLDRPVVLRLTGNAHADLAGCRLRFENPGPTVALPADAHFNPLQQGTVGDLTASRKVRVFDIPFDQAYAMIKRGEKPPEHWANSLYLDWFSQANGRVVIEGADWKIEISAPEWHLTPQDETERAADAAAGMAGFMQQLSQAVEKPGPQAEEELDEWDEFEWERALRDSDARTERYLKLLEEHQGDPNAEELIAREMGWDTGESPTGEDGEETEAADPLNQEMNLDPEPPDPQTEGVDWIRTGEGDIAHPLQHRCFRSAMGLWHECDRLGLAENGDADLVRLLTEFQITSVKLAGALNGLAHGRGLREGGFIVACLKRALGHLHAAQAGLEQVTHKGLLPQTTLTRIRAELFEIREGILALMTRFRARG